MLMERDVNEIHALPSLSLKLQLLNFFVHETVFLRLTFQSN